MAVNIYNDFTTPSVGQANIGIMPVEITSTGSIKDGLSYKVVVAYRYEDQSDIVDFMPAFIENMATVQTALNLDGYISVTDITQTDVYTTQAVENGQLINYYIFKYDLQIAADSGDFEASENELQIWFIQQELITIQLHKTLTQILLGQILLGLQILINLTTHGLEQLNNINYGRRKRTNYNRRTD